MSIDIEIYVTPAGKEPFSSWEKKLSRQTRAIVIARLARLKLGLLGDCKALKNTKALYELRIHHGPGYRVYFGKKRRKSSFCSAVGIRELRREISKKPKSFGRNI